MGRVAREFWPLAALLALLLAGLVAHSLRAGQLVRRARSEQAAAQLAADSALRRLEALQRAGIVGQIPSLISHELMQPLGAIACRVHAFGALLSGSAPKVQAALQNSAEIERIVARAAAIVNRVREYARSPKSERSLVDAAAVVSRVCSAVARPGRFAVQPQLELAPGAAVWANELELELVVANLLKNALEASSEAVQPSVAVRLDCAGGRMRLEIANTGRILAGEALEALTTPLASTKKNGLGLGLSLVRTIVENHGGTLTLAPRPEGGLLAVLELALAQESAKEESDGQQHRI